MRAPLRTTRALAVGAALVTGLTLTATPAAAIELTYYGPYNTLQYCQDDYTRNSSGWQPGVHYIPCRWGNPEGQGNGYYWGRIRV
ncbi:hypothetical protein [Rhizohabitans arisaemae]|uniref:hypothetical protein n=1 Tax=Rhizohabitans arisaemae TaxID=2720610 RepID=UPI0024B21C29|nr:hypothetical protein [Rhizohabitans arisaemae]